MTPSSSRHSPISLGLQRLPTELLDHIVGFLQDDVLNLKGCSLVSRAWIPPVRRALFNSLAIVVWKDGGDVLSFVSRLRTSPTDVGSYVRHLSLDDMPLSRRFVKDRFPMNGHTMATILSLLPNLKKLELKSLVYSPMPSDLTLPPRPDNQAQQKYHLDRLVIHVLGVSDTEDAADCLLDALSVLSEIDELEILPHIEDSRSDPAKSALDASRSKRHAQMPRIHKLIVCFPYLSTGILDGDVVSAFASTLPGTLTVRGCATDAHFKVIGGLTSGAASTLEHFEFEFFSWQMLRTLQDARRDWTDLHLDRCTSMRTLTINRLVKNPTSEAAPIDTAVHTLLSYIPPHTVRTLYLRAYATTTPTSLSLSAHSDLHAGLKDWDWAGLRKVLEKMVRTGLEEVVLVTWGEPMGESTRAVVMSGVGEDVAGLLRFEVEKKLNFG